MERPPNPALGEWLAFVLLVGLAVWIVTKICEKEENWDPDSSDDDTTLLDQILGDNLALAVGTLEWDLPHMRRNLGGAHPDVLAIEEILLQARDVLRAREASRLGL